MVNRVLILLIKYRIIIYIHGREWNSTEHMKLAMPEIIQD